MSSQHTKDYKVFGLTRQDILLSRGRYSNTSLHNALTGYVPIPISLVCASGPWQSKDFDVYRVKQKNGPLTNLQNLDLFLNFFAPS